MSWCKRLCYHCIALTKQCERYSSTVHLLFIFATSSSFHVSNTYSSICTYCIHTRGSMTKASSWRIPKEVIKQQNRNRKTPMLVCGTTNIERRYSNARAPNIGYINLVLFGGAVGIPTNQNSISLCMCGIQMLENPVLFPLRSNSVGNYLLGDTCLFCGSHVAMCVFLVKSQSSHPGQKSKKSWKGC